MLLSLAENPRHPPVLRSRLGRQLLFGEAEATYFCLDMFVREISLEHNGNKNLL